MHPATALSNAMTFPIDPNSPGGPDRSEYLRRHYADHPPLRDRLATLALTGNTATPAVTAPDESPDPVVVAIRLSAA
jgi:hypothetical protein